MMESKLGFTKKYSVNSILEKTDNEYAIDLSLKHQIKMDIEEESIDDCSKINDTISNNYNSEKINNLLLNLIHQKDMNHISKNFHPSTTETIRPFRVNYEKNNKMSNPPTNMPWNFLRPIYNIPGSGNHIFNQFQNIIFNKRSPNQQMMTGPLYQRPNFKNIFPQSSIVTNDNSNSYFHNLSQIFNSRLNVNQNLDNSQFLSIGAENFNAKHFTPSNIEMNSHFNLQNILKSTSNRKRKRTKVTDTRLPRRTITHQSFNSFSQIMEPDINELQRFPSFINSPSNSSQSSHSEETHGDPKKYTLTPIHLRKAKLMFLYTRYPNSQMLKSYFPDITFCKQNTAQLVKWFSNFREFYYSEMEKAVQRALSNGIQHAKDIDVTIDSELFKNLMTHFNKKKQIVVPCEFLTTVQITLREFFDAISTGKNLHQSWKKPIYKNIAKLDQPLPEFFKDMNWMMELAKDENENITS